MQARMNTHRHTGAQRNMAVEKGQGHQDFHIIITASLLLEGCNLVGYGLFIKADYKWFTGLICP